MELIFIIILIVCVPCLIIIISYRNRKRFNDADVMVKRKKANSKELDTFLKERMLNIAVQKDRVKPFDYSKEKPID